MADGHRRVRRRGAPAVVPPAASGTKEDSMTADPAEPVLDRFVRAYQDYRSALEQALSAGERQLGNQDPA